MKEITAELGLSVPEYVSNHDVYMAMNECGKVLEASHIEAHSMAIYNLPPEEDASASE